MSSGRVISAVFIVAIFVALIILGGGLRRQPEDRRSPRPAPSATCHQTYSESPPVSIHCQ